MRLLDGHGVFVIWQGTWNQGPVSIISDEVTSVDESLIVDVSHEESDKDGEEDNAFENHESELQSTIVFKCIGATRENSYQVALKKARDLLENGEEVPVVMEHEMDNSWDPNAIAFKCLIDDSYARIGYVVREVAEEVLGKR